MSFNRLETDDFVISSDSITSTVWSTDNQDLTSYYTSSVQEAQTSGKYYLNVYQTSSVLSGSAVQFAVAYGNEQGSGSEFYNNAVTGSTYSRTIYGQYRNLVLGSETAAFIFGNQTSSDFYAISLDRARYKESLLPGTWTLTLSASAGSIVLTDDSLVNSSSVQFNDAGRVFQIVSGSAGTINTETNSDGWSPNSGSYGLFMPDIATLLLNPLALTGSNALGGINLATSRSFDTDGLNNRRLFQALESGSSFKLNSEETITSDYVFVRAKSSQFNYSENPSYISGSTGEVVFDDFVNNPQTYITTVGLYNDNSELLAVAKMSRPLKKDFTKEALVRVKLDF
jgi:hypothetical protein